ncbi:Secreted protein OS=Streptomyces glaucescens OX=1907 GN=SGLAU_25265 PE=4 SV=1 [Streptomyces glaucescens]
MQLSATSYDERLTAPRSWWLISFLVGLSMALILLPFGTLPMLGGLVGGTAVAAVAASSYGSQRIRVVGGSLIAGEAKIPVTALGEAHVLDPEEALGLAHLQGRHPRLPAAAGLHPPALRVEVTDPEDPTPYLYLSTREPERLAAAIEAARTATAS